jgi:hypothetical protein
MTHRACASVWIATSFRPRPRMHKHANCCLYVPHSQPPEKSKCDLYGLRYRLCRGGFFCSGYRSLIGKVLRFFSLKFRSLVGFLVESVLVIMVNPKSTKASYECHRRRLDCEPSRIQRTKRSGAIRNFSLEPLRPQHLPSLVRPVRRHAARHRAAGLVNVGWRHADLYILISISYEIKSRLRKERVFRSLA